MTLTINIAEMQSEIEAHIAADTVRGGLYWDADTGTGSFIGCLAHSSDATELHRRYGLPLPLVRICESIFERLPAADRPVFFREVGQAIGRDGRDLTRVHWAFLADTLRHLPKTEAQHVVDPVIAGMDLLAQGKKWPPLAAWVAEARATRAAREARAARTAEADAAEARATRAAREARARARARAAAARAAEAARAARTAEADAAWAAARAAAWDAARAEADAARALAAWDAAWDAETQRQRAALLHLIEAA